jgi:hypothetical protein
MSAFGDFCDCDFAAAGRLFGAPVDSITVPFEPPLLPEDDEPDVVAVELGRSVPPLPSAWSCPKNSHQTRSTLSGSFWYFSYISSTSHSLAPNPDMELSSDDSGTASFASSNARCV